MSLSVFCGLRICAVMSFFRLLRRNRIILWLLASVPYNKDSIWLVGQIFYVYM